MAAIAAQTRALPQRAGVAAGRRAARRCAAIRVYASAEKDQYWGQQFTVLSTGESATAHLATMFAADMRAGDAYCLKGDEGAGKSTFSRAFIRAAMNDLELDVQPPHPSLRPNEYTGAGQTVPGEFGELPLLHYDVGGLSRPSDADCEVIAASFPRTVSIIEWAELLREWGAAPEQRLALYFRRLPSSPDSDARLITVVPHTGSWEVRVKLLRSNLSITGPSEGLMMLSDDMASQMTAGLPEQLLLAK